MRPSGFEPIASEPIADVLRLTFTAANTNPASGLLLGAMSVPLDDWNRSDWSFVEVQARATGGLRNLGLNFNHTDDEPYGDGALPFRASGAYAPLVVDGTTQTYRLALDKVRQGPDEPQWSDLAIWFTARADAMLDLLSVRVIAREALFAHARVGVRTERRAQGEEPEITAPDRRSVFTHPPAVLRFPVAIPPQARLDVGLGVIRETAPVRFRVVADRGGELEPLLDEIWSDPGGWAQRSLDLSHLAGETLELRLETTSDAAGTVALWSTPVLSGRRSEARPNVIFYVIDGGGADYMSAFGYERRTTPRLEALMREGALFERAYSTASWTRPSTVAFSTSLHHSVLGGLRNGSNPIPEEAPTMAELMHGEGYLTALLTANSNAGRVSSLERGVDFFRERGIRNNSVSSVELHRNFWSWRRDYPAEPYWVHFQTTDVHNDHRPVEPFAGTFIDSERRQQAEEWVRRAYELEDGQGMRIEDAVTAIGVPQTDYWQAQWDLHDETMLHQDHQLGVLVDRIKARGEWERTLLVVAADHSVAAGSWDYGLLARDPQPPNLLHRDRASPILRRGVSHVPLLFVWPGHIEEGLRFREPVSMIDVLPTLLDLVGIAKPEPLQGRSLAPFLLGTAEWTPEPIFFDQFDVREADEALSGRIEVIDGRWGASLDVNPDPEAPDSDRRPSPLLLYDLDNDPDALHSLHEEHPDLVEKYQALLRRKLREHVALGKSYTRPPDSALTADQLETLRSLGYL